MMSFVILHYKNINDTVDCLESIKRIKENEISIIIVDNHTLSKEEELLLRKYTSDIILLDENFGFAKANNIGCNYAKEKYNPDFIAVINNDTLITQRDFVSRINKIYDNTGFDIFGPKIITDGGQSVNPFPAYKSLKQVEKAISKTKKLIKIYKSFILRNLLKFYIKCKRKIVKPKLLKNGDKAEYDVALHGCFIVFSKKYLNKYENVFYNETFLYHEEEFLEYRRQKDHLITYYDPFVEIYHKEGASLNNCFINSEYKKLLFKNNEILKSLILLKEKYIQEGLKHE